MSEQIQKIGNVLELSVELGKIIEDYFNNLKVYVINDIDNEDHIYAITEIDNKPIFDLLISTKRKFGFLWYFTYPSEKGIEMVKKMKEKCLNSSYDLMVRYVAVKIKPNLMIFNNNEKNDKIQTKIENFILKHGNPFLEDVNTINDKEFILTYRNFDWHKEKDILDKILKRSKEMFYERLKKHPDKIQNAHLFLLYAGGGFSFCFPKLAFGIRDIDVEVLMTNKWFIVTRQAYAKYTEIDELGKPKFLDYKTRKLDLMINSLHSDITNDRKSDLILYLNEMRSKSNRWATMAQRPFIDLETKEILFVPYWIRRLFFSHLNDDLFKETAVNFENWGLNQ